MPLTHPQTACVFPGQGSQSVGMMSSLCAYPAVRDTFTEAASLLHYDLWKLVQEGPVETLNQTEYTQPALLAAGVAVWRVFVERIPNMPAFLAGHSLGEYTALICAGSLDFVDAVRLVQKRGQLMQAAVPVGAGAMAAILGSDEATLKEICGEAAKETGQVVDLANLNCPGQTIIAGALPAVERAMVLAKQNGAKRVLLLPVSVPAHTTLMREASQLLQSSLDAIDIKRPSIPVLNNVDADFYWDPESIKSGLVRQLYSPVRWSDLISVLFSKCSVQLFLECGPGSVLTGLGRRIAPNAKHHALNSPQSLEEAWKAYG